MAASAQTDDLLAALRAHIERQDVRIEELERVMGFDFLPPLEWGLTPQQGRLFGCLMTRDLVTQDAAMAALYGDRVGADNEPAPKIIDVFICHIRKKLKPFGLSVETRWGQGYFLTQDTKAAVREIMAPAEAA